MCTHKNRLTEAILMSTHNIPFSIQNKKITINYSKSAPKGVFPRDSRTTSKQPWKTSHQCSSH